MKAAALPGLLTAWLSLGNGSVERHTMAT